ncbi:hypothetical protein KY289_035721 [Solanum tuberosum]|nr:hypothetical protein KY289_035721 [Solanum tuberosum]
MKTSNADKWRLQGHEGPVMGMACDASGHKGVFTSIMFHPDPNRLQVVNLCNLHDYRCLTTIPTLESVETVCIIGSDSPFAAGLASSKNPQAKKRLWDCENKACVGIGIGHMGAVGAVALSKKQQNFFVSGSSDRTLKVWNMDGVTGNNEEIITLKAKAVVAAHDKDINSLAVAPNDSLVCSGSQDHTACIWSLPVLFLVVTMTSRNHYSVDFSVSHYLLLLKDMAVSPDSDGFIKLWTVRNEECIATFDQHDDKIWALAIGKKTEMLATGSGDAEEGVLRVQELKNALIDADYTRAIQIAFELRRPHGLLDIFTELHRKRDAGDQIVKAVDALSKEELRLHLEYIREWNTKTVLSYSNFFLSCTPITKMIEIKGNEGVLEDNEQHHQDIQGKKCSEKRKSDISGDITGKKVKM